MQISSEGLTLDGQEKGMNLYGRQDVPAGTLVAVSVSGTAPAPDTNAGAEQQGQQGRDAQQGGGESAGVSIQQVPGRLDVLKWPLIAGFVCVFTLGAILLARKPVVVVAGAAADTQKKSKATAAVSPTNGAASLAEVDAAIGSSLDALKER